MNNSSITPIGIAVLAAVGVFFGVILLGKIGVIDYSKIGLLEKTSDAVPIPDIDEVKEVGMRSSGLVSGGFNISEDTPGYENYLVLSRGCSGRDCIPSIDKPKFESIEDASSWLLGTDIVFVLEYKGEVRVYPQRIMNWHEIVNDEIKGDPIAITFCPLCGSSLAFDRKVDGQVLEFGVSGFLHNNDLVMYDRQTDSLWQQITGEAIVGENFGKSLAQVSMSGMLWSQLKDEFESARVLSRDTGFSRDYDRYPYGSYEQDRGVSFPVEGGVDQTIHPKTIVYGIELNGEFKAYPDDKIKDEKKIGDKVGGVQVEIDYNGGDVTAKNLQTGEEIVTTRLFWFAWKVFRPDTKLY